MPRLATKLEVVRALFARSGNQCAFPGCTQPLINEKNLFIGQICHIEGALPGSERHNPDQTDEERRGYGNLVLLCYPHHIETNDVTLFPTTKLKKIKQDHEAKFDKSDYKIDEVALFKIMAEMEDYWAHIERINKFEHSMADLAIEINAKGTFFEISRSCKETIQHLIMIYDEFYESDNRLQSDFEHLLKRKNIDPRIFKDIPYYENPFHARNLHLHSLAIPNWLQRLRIYFKHMEIKYLEEFLKTHSQDKDAKDLLDRLKEAFAKLAQHAIHVD
jgi:hypothetical protein